METLTARPTVLFIDDDADVARSRRWAATDPCPSRGRILRGTTLHVSGATDALVANEVQWARERAEASNRVVLSFHPEGDGTGCLHQTKTSKAMRRRQAGAAPNIRPATSGL
jgi:hypothetical protein